MQTDSDGTPVRETEATKATTCSLEEMQLHVGERLQMELKGAGDPQHFYTTLIGYVPGHSVLMRTPLAQGVPVPVREGEQVTVRAFSGRHAYTFESRVDRVCRVPYAYLHLAYPARVQRTVIRGALRVRVDLPGTATIDSRKADPLPVAVTVADLSVSGALLEAARGLGQVGEKLELGFKFVVEPNNYEVKFVTHAEIQSVRTAKRERGAGEIWTHGVRFGRLHATETLLLQSYIQQILLADRSRVV
jgi:c-di-GMP-binding flagellar brake protein YcgR